jgi:Fic family protein
MFLGEEMSMAQKNGVKTETPPAELSEVIDLEEATTTKATPEPTSDAQEVEDSLNALKALLSTVEKLQKVRQEVGDIKSLLVRMLDGEVMSGEDLEQLKAGVGGLFRLVRAYSDHQTALVNAQPARTLLDQVLKLSSTNSSH